MTLYLQLRPNLGKERWESSRGDPGIRKCWDSVWLPLVPIPIWHFIALTFYTSLEFERELSFSHLSLWFRRCLNLRSVKFPCCTISNNAGNRSCGTSPQWVLPCSWSQVRWNSLWLELIAKGQYSLVLVYTWARPCLMYWVQWKTRKARPPKKSREESRPATGRKAETSATWEQRRKKLRAHHRGLKTIRESSTFNCPRARTLTPSRTDFKSMP